MQQVKVRQLNDTVTVNPDLFSVSSRESKQTVTVSPELNSINVKQSYATVIVFSDTTIETFTYIDGGLYNEEGILVSAGFYNTTEWDEVWASLA